MEEIKESRSQRITRNTKANSESIGVASAVVLTWLVSTYTNAEVPPEVVASLGVMIGAFAARFRDN